MTLIPLIIPALTLRDMIEEWRPYALRSKLQRYILHTAFIFAYPRCELWRKTRPMMKSPCRQLVGVEELPTDCKIYPLHRDHTQRFEVYAVFEDDFLKETCQRTPLKSADIILQLWQYPPGFFEQDGHIDELSRTLVLNDASEEEINRMFSEIEMRLKR